MVAVAVAAPDVAKFAPRGKPAEILVLPKVIHVKLARGARATSDAGEIKLKYRSR